MRATSVFALATLTLAAPCQQLIQAAREATAATKPGSPERLTALLFEANELQRFDLAATVAIAEEALLLATELGDNVARAIAMAEKAGAQVAIDGADAGLATLATAQQTLPKDAPIAARAKMAMIAANIYWTTDRSRECMAALRQAIDMADEANLARTMVKANILAIGIVGWAEDAEHETQRILELAKDTGSEGLMLEARIVRTVMHQRSGDAEAAMEEFQKLHDEARRLGDRASEGYLDQLLARRHAISDIEATKRLGEQSLAVYRQWGHKEHIAEALNYLATVAIFSKQPDVGLRHCEQAIATITGMGMNVRMLELLGSAAHLASIQGLTEKSLLYGNRHTELNQTLSAASNYNERGRLWRESTNLRHALREAQQHHLAEIGSMSARIDRIVLVASTSGGLLLIVASILLLRGKRRLELANTGLKTAMAAAQNLQEERAALQQNLQQIERLDSIGLLAGGFAHDFNNILVGVRGNAQLLLEDDGIQADQREMLEQIVHSSGRAAALCKDILSYAHAAPTPMSVIDLREVLRGLIQMAKSGFGAGIEVTCELGTAPRLIFADRSQIEQVFLNVLVNAGDAIDGRGLIQVAIDSRTLEGKPPSGNWFGEFTGETRTCIAVSVRDDGHGMNTETIRRIFDPFFSTRFAGRGIGLAAVFGILRRHHGVVEVHSELGHGTLFTVYLPEHDQVPTANADQDAATLASAPPATRTATILIVDDEPLVCQVARAALQTHGHTVLTANGGKEALAQLEQHHSQIELALIDVTMPDMDGPTLARKLRKLSPEMAIVLMTGHRESAIRTTDLDVPMLSKPFDLNSLLQAVSSQLQTHTA